MLRTGIPSSVEKGGDWTLQRLVRETEPLRLFAAEAAPVAAGSAAEELLKVRIDALDITVLRGGPTAVGAWATQHGFRLPPDYSEEEIDRRVEQPLRDLGLEAVKNLQIG